MKNKGFKWAGIVLALALILAGGWALKALDSQMLAEDAPVSILITTDMPQAGSLEDMVESAGVVVKGRYVEELELYNQSCDPNDPAKEHPTTRRMARIFRFAVDEVLKGETASEIQVSLPYSVTGFYSVEGERVEYSYIDPFFIQPEFDAECLLFLDQDGISGHYYCALEPAVIQYQDGQAVLQSALLDRPQRLQKGAEMEKIGQNWVPANMAMDKLPDFIGDADFESVCQQIVEMVK